MVFLAYRSLIRVVTDIGYTGLDSKVQLLFIQNTTLLFVLCYNIMYYFIDLENFKTQLRSAVNVREGQGVVLLCGTPMHAGGKVDYSHIFTLLQNSNCLDM